jgi:hypothetical protein
MGKYYEKREILMPDLSNEYIIYNDKTREVKTYRANNRQGQKYRAIKFFKAKKAVNYLGPRKDIKTYLRGKTKEERMREDKKEIMFIDETKKFKNEK